MKVLHRIPEFWEVEAASDPRSASAVAYRYVRTELRSVTIGLHTDGRTRLYRRWKAARRDGAVTAFTLAAQRSDRPTFGRRKIDTTSLVSPFLKQS